MLEFTEWYEWWMIRVLGSMSIPMLGGSGCLARWPGGSVELAVLHYSSFLFSEKFGWVKNTWSFLAVGSESLATPGRKWVSHLRFLTLESRWLCKKHQSVLLIKAWKIENIRITPLGGLWALKPLEERTAIGKIEIACFCFFYKVCCQIYLNLLIFNRCWTREYDLFQHQTNEDTTPPGFYFPKVSGRGGGVCVVWRRGLLAGSSPLSRYL